MSRRLPGLYVLHLFLLLFFFECYQAIAQPTLPNLSGSADKGVVLLSWTCQYNGVKAIAVLHSTDSIYNFRNIGYVKKLDKGIQAFVDGHPDTGKNYYKLSIVFNSGLTWTSNRKLVYVDISQLGFTRLALPRNDSLQKFIVTEELFRPAPVKVPGITPKVDSEDAAPRKTTGHKVSLSFDADSLGANAPEEKKENLAPAPKKKITISFDEPDVTAPLYIKSVYIFTDPLSGHVKIDLPEDVRKHNYSVKFYDRQNHLIFEVPRINAAKILIDKRNFQHKGLYKFVLRKDAVELESGFVNVEL
jgi:hypothetical protein